MDMNIKAHLERLRVRLALMIGRGKVTLVYPAAKGAAQRLQSEGLAEELRDGFEHVLPYGDWYRPIPGAEAIYACVGGLRSHMVALLVHDPRFGPGVELMEGERVLFTAAGQRIHLKADGSVDVWAPTDISLEGENVKVKARHRLDLEGEDLTMYATRSRTTDVAGFGERLTCVDGPNYKTETWQQGAIVVGEPDHGHHPERVPGAE